MTAIPKPTPRPRIRKPLRSRPHGVGTELRERVFIRDGYLCGWCDTPGGALDAHHVIRRSQGGKDTVDNLRSVHRICHSYLHDHPAEAKSRGFLA